MKKVLITGGAGFIGSHLCDFFLKKNYKVLCLDNLITGSLDNIQQHRHNRDFVFFRHNIAEPLRIRGEVDLILHFASPASPVDYLRFPIQTLKVGSRGTHHCLGLAKAKGARLLLASTSEVYGDPQVHPQREDYWGHVNPVGPRGVYDEAKRFAEALTMAYHRIHKIDTGIARIFNTYGPRMRLMDGRAIPNFVSEAMEGRPMTIFGDGTQTRSFCFISDLVAGIYKLANSSLHEPVNLGNPQELSLKRLAVVVKRLTHSDSSLVFRPLPQDDPRRRRPDISLAKKKLNWQPKTGLEEGLCATIMWFKEHIS